MRKNRYIYWLIPFVAYTLMVGSCKLPEALSDSDKLVSPVTFDIPDSALKNPEIPKWREFFTDPFLVSLIDTAIKNNADLKIATQRIFQAQAMLKFSRRSFYPDLNATGSLGVTQYGKYTESGVGNYDLNLSSNITPDQKVPSPVPDVFLGLQTSWEIGFAGKLRNQKKGAYFRYLSTQDGRNFVQTQLVSEVARLYYELLSADNQLKIVRKNLNLQEKAMEIIDIQKKSGQINELVVKQFRVQLLFTQALEMEKSQNVVAIENELNILLGRYTGHAERGDTLITDRQLRAFSTGIPSQMMLHRPDIREAENNLNANAAMLKSARAAFFPVLNVSANIALNGFNPSYFFNPVSFAYMVAGSVTEPLLNRNRIMTDYWLQASERKQAFLNYQKTILLAVNEVNTYYNRMISWQHISGLKQQELSELQAATGIANDLFLTGYANYLEVLTVRKSVLDSEIQLTEARKEFFVAYISLYKALGGGWE